MVKRSHSVKTNTRWRSPISIPLVILLLSVNETTTRGVVFATQDVIQTPETAATMLPSFSPSFAPTVSPSLALATQSPTITYQPTNSPTPAPTRPCRRGLDGDFLGYILQLIQDNPEIAQIECIGEGLNGTIPSELSNLTNLTIVDLSENEFSGEIPAELAKLIRLQRLDLRGNELSGEIPSGLGNLSNLITLDLRDNLLLGGLPPWLGNLTNLTALDLRGNELSGEIPAEVGNLAHLILLDLRGNELSGEIPSELGNLANLIILDLRDNLLLGGIPPWLGNLTHLQQLDLRDNRFSGKIPTELGNLINLQRLDFQGNRYLSGEIPPWLGNLTKLLRLEMFNNNLSGTIPTELGLLTSLVRLGLGGNDLTGKIPTHLGHLRSLTHIGFVQNKLSGLIPTELVELTKLKNLYLRDNKLSGEIPTQLGTMINLQRLYLYDNELFGTIPSQLGSLTRLQQLRLYQNALSGEIPSQLGNLNSLQRLYLYDNNLVGEIPPQLGKLSNLRIWEAYDNKLFGEIPSQLGNLTKLQLLLLSDTELSGKIPTELGALPNLQRIDLRRNELSGKIPTELGKLTNLKRLGLNGNKLLGEIPTEVINLVNLERVGLHDNNLSGRIPTQLGNLTNLQQVRLYNNNLSGRIPTQLGKLTKLRWLWFSNNKLSGEIPTQLANLTSLQYLYLQDNQLIIDSSVVLFLDNPRSVKKPEIRLSSNTNFDTTCDSQFLEWYPDISTSIDDRELIRCSENSNIYGELGLNPHVLRVDENAPRTHATWRVSAADVPITSSSIQLKWSYMTTNETIQSFSINDFDTFDYADRQSAINNLEQLELFRNCSQFEKPVAHFAPTKTHFGFELTWGNKRRCILSSEASIGNETFQHVITNLQSETYYEINIRPFYLTFSENVVLSEYLVFGIQSATLRLKTHLERNGYWLPNLDSLSDIQVCPQPEFCKSKSYSFVEANSTDRHCAEHHTGVYCSDCVEGYNLSSSGCEKCDDGMKEEHKIRFIWCTAAAVLVVVLYFLKIFLTSGVFTWPFKKRKCCKSVKNRKTRKVWKTPKKGFKHAKTVFSRHLSTKFKIWLVTSQILLSLQHSFSTKSVEESNIDGVILILSLQLERFYREIEVFCYTDVDFYKKLLFVSFAPIGVVLPLWIVYYLLYQSKMLEKKTMEALYRETYKFSLIVSFISYAPVSQSIVETFLCESINFADGRENYLTADYRISCDSDEHSKYEVFAGFMIVLYPVGILMIYVYILHRRRHLFLAENKHLNQSNSDEKVEKRLKLVRFLTKPYNYKAYWFEIYELFRRLAMTLIVAIVTSYEDEIGNRYAAETYTFVIGMASVIFVMYVQPYKNNDDFLFSVLSLFILCFSTLIRALGEFSDIPVTDVSQLSKYESTMFTVLAWLEFSLFLIFMMVNVCQYYMNAKRHADCTTNDSIENADENMPATDSHILISDIDMNMLYEEETCHMIEKLKKELASTKGLLQENVKKLQEKDSMLQEKEQTIQELEEMRKQGNQLCVQ